MLFNLLALRAMLSPVSYPNDLALHLQQVTLAQHLLSHGQLPFSHWYPHLSLGSPFFVQYQSSSAILTGAIGLVVGTQHAFVWSLYLLLALWPICVYWTGRLLGWGQWESGVAAVLAPLLFSVTGHGFEHQAYAWLGSGLWSQEWAMWTLPLAWGFSWRYISERRYLFGAVATLAATIALHFLMAYLAGLILIVLVVVRPSDVLRRLGRAAIVGGSALLATLWVTVPLLVNAKWTAIDEFQVKTVINDSYGAGRVLGWLVSGQLFDYERLPVITVLFAIGLIVCIARFRTDERARVLVCTWVLAMLLFFGRPTLGWAIDLLPGNKNLLLQRYITGVQLSSLFIAGVGAVFAARFLVNWVRQWWPDARRWRADSPRSAVLWSAAAVALVVAVLAPGWSQLASYGSDNASWVASQQRSDAVQGRQVSSLLALAKHLGGGRVFAGLPADKYSDRSYWGLNFTVGAVPVYNFMEDHDVDAAGLTLRTSSLMTGPEAYLDETNPGDYSVLGIRYLLMPAGHAPPVPARFLRQAGPYVLWTVGAPGYVQVVDTTGSIKADADNLGKNLSSFMESFLPSDGKYFTIAYAGLPAADPTLPNGHDSGPAGRVVSEHDHLDHGKASVVVFANRIAVVLLHSSFDPGWTATIDGNPASTEMVAPALVGVTVAPGVHTVVFQYRGYGSYLLLFAIAICTLLGVGLGPMAWRRYGKRGREPGSTAPAA